MRLLRQARQAYALLGPPVLRKTLYAIAPFAGDKKAGCRFSGSLLSICKGDPLDEKMALRQPFFSQTPFFRGISPVPLSLLCRGHFLFSLMRKGSAPPRHERQGGNVGTLPQEMLFGRTQPANPAFASRPLTRAHRMRSQLAGKRCVIGKLSPRETNKIRTQAVYAGSKPAHRYQLSRGLGPGSAWRGLPAGAPRYNRAWI